MMLSPSLSFYLFIYLFIMLLTLFFQAVQAIFKAEEITNFCYQQLDNERKRRVSAVQSFNIANQSIKDLRQKLAEQEKARKSADSALEGAQRQAEEQRQLLREAKDQLASSKEEIATLKKKLEEAQKLKDHVEKLRAEAEKVKVEVEKAKVEVKKARDEAKQHGYDVGIAKTEDTFWAQVLTVCRTYCTQTQEEALNQAGVEASSKLRRLESIFFPPAIRVSDLPSTQGEVASIVADPVQEAQPQDPLPLNQSEQSKEL